MTRVLGQSPRYQLQSTLEWAVPGEIPEPERTEHTRIRRKDYSCLYTRDLPNHRLGKGAALGSLTVRHPRTPALALCGYSGTNWTQLNVCFLGNVFLLHLTSDLKSICLPPPFLLEAHESQSRQTNDSPGQVLVKHASLGGSSVIKCERGWLCR